MPASQTRLADFVPYRMAITSNAVSGLIAGEYRNEFGLKIPEWRIMAVLGDAGQLTQRDLVRFTLMDKVAVNRACKVLEDRGLIRRSPNEADGRSHHLELTEAGLDMHGKIWPQALDIYEKIFAALSPREIEKLRALLDKLRASVSALEGDAK
ncbi:MarR family winged helix-turn-helix transcriptional regulator [Novosphingobium olei]|uniref:Winged helix-turn-helix transcriptional regulator n=1 Tax=Novosphingobium olei TaxID=2728851 RepID=A0A7Y0BL20_9SPHN|nr:MarR family winged helix-turn-helix transcriptional regulator [Novosphingobium olei]NML92442.1 winged helix-turn-helix transcriptional regulator [Novosphingobium olei]BEV01702.1 MarR family winged helix-turn-helix transcriptional regulator [Novosphingobium olei]